MPNNTLFAEHFIAADAEYRLQQYRDVCWLFGENIENMANIEDTNGVDPVLQSVIDAIPYELFNDVLIKPLPTIKVTKDVTKPIWVEGKAEATEFETVSEEVDALFQTGVVLTIPTNTNGQVFNFKVGDTVLFPRKAHVFFDLYRDTIIVKSYDIIGRCK